MNLYVWVVIKENNDVLYSIGNLGIYKKGVFRIYLKIIVIKILFVEKIVIVDDSYWVTKVEVSLLDMIGILELKIVLYFGVVETVDKKIENVFEIVIVVAGRNKILFEIKII